MPRAKSQPPIPAVPSLRDRIVEFRRVPGSHIRPHPLNPRAHPPIQRERLRAVLEEIGVAGVLLTYHSERNGQALTLVDGELRATDHPETEWPCAITDLTDAEADLLLTVHDPLAALAEYTRHEQERLLLEGVSTGNAVLQAFVSELAEARGLFGDIGKDATEDDHAALVRHSQPVKIALAVADVRYVEQAIRATGIDNRGDALLAICQQYLNESPHADRTTG